MAQIGLDDTVQMIAATRNIGADIAWVRATVPTAATPLELSKIPTTAPTATWTANWHTPASPGKIEGVVIVKFDAEDTAQPLPNHGDQFVQPYLDLVPPFVSLTWPPNGHMRNTDGLITLTGLSEMLSTVHISATRRSDNQATTAQAGSNALGHWQSNMSLSGDGIYDLAYRATDRAGNVGPIASSMLMIDSIAPTVVITTPSLERTSFRLNWLGQDAGSGIRSYDLEYRDAEETQWVRWFSGTPQTQAVFGGIFGHSYYFRIQAQDRAGNQSGWVEAGPVQLTLGAVKKYYNFGGQRVAMREGDEVYYLNGDHLGSTSLTTDASGEMVAESRYLPYGQVRWITGTLTTDFTYTGQRAEGFNLLDYNARFYSPFLGRFVSADTIVQGAGNPEAFNRYAYAMNNPLKNIDPSGHCIVQYSGDVIMGQGPYGTSGLCPHTESPHAEAAYAVTQYAASPPPDNSIGGGLLVTSYLLVAAFFPEAITEETLVFMLLQQALVEDMQNYPENLQIGVIFPGGFESYSNVKGITPPFGATGSLVDDMPRFGVGWNGSAFPKNNPKTLGVLEIPGYDPIPLQSGTNKAVDSFFSLGSGRTKLNVNHVETQAAGIMELEGVREANLYINNPAGPCGSNAGCIMNLNKMLPEDSILNLYWPEGAASFRGGYLVK